MVILALTPPWDFNVTMTLIHPLLWLWLIFISGFLCFAFMHQQVSAWLKLLVIWAFVSCFLSSAPFISFTLYFSMIACAYFYALCKRIENWDLVFKSMQAIFFVVCTLLILQGIGKDSLLNFNMSTPGVVGTIGNRMTSSSFVCSLAPFLIFNPINWIPLTLVAWISYSSGAILALGMGTLVIIWCTTKRARVWLISAIIAIPIFFALYTGDIDTFKGKAGRRQVWAKTVELTIKRPLGYGIGTYKTLFPVMCGKEIISQQPSGQRWTTAHNDFLQIAFELGWPGCLLILGWIVSIVLKIKDPVKLAGLMILAGTMSVHFPLRTIQAPLLILAFLAFCERDKNGYC